MEFYEFPIPTALHGEQLKEHLGADEVYVRGDKLVIGSENLTLEQVTAGLASYMYAAVIDPLLKARADGITHAISLGFSQASAEAMFP